MLPQPERSPHARRGAFTRPDPGGMGTETEVTRLLAAHVRWLKPRLVIETGTFHADTATHLAHALAENAREGFLGELRTYEVDADAYGVAVRNLGRAPTHPDALLFAVPRRLQDDLHTLRGRLVDLAFIDSAYEAREADIEAIAPLLAPRGIVFVHDADMPPMKPIIRALRKHWRVLLYPTPRGLAALQPRWQPQP